MATGFKSFFTIALVVSFSFNVYANSDSEGLRANGCNAKLRAIRWSIHDLSELATHAPNEVRRRWRKLYDLTQYLPSDSQLVEDILDIIYTTWITVQWLCRPAP